MPDSAKSPMNGADILVECLIRHGVDTVFAYPGGASMPLHQSLTRVTDRLRTILPRHEQGGGFMAQGYARTTGKVGVCMATSGPGATNFVTVLADAKMDSVPMIAITGQVGTPVIGTDAFQETPIVEVCRPITKHHYLIQRTEDITRVMKEAFHIASTGRPGPVIVDVPKDVQIRSDIVPDWDPPMNLPGYRAGADGRAERPASRDRRDPPVEEADRLRRRRNHCQRRGPGPARVCRGDRHPGRADAARPRRVPGRSLPVPAACSACTGRCTRTSRSTTPTCCWPSACASTTA